MTNALILLVAMVMDAVFGEPKVLWSRVPHPAVLMGRLIGACDRRFNTGRHRRARGVICVVALCLLAGALGWIIGQVPVLAVITAAILLAQRSLVDHVRAVADGLRQSEEAGRAAVAMIVGRDTATLDEAGIARSAIESAAENFSDGVIAPIFWFIIGGLPGLMIYKIVNTADSMIGYLTPRHAAFGWAAARLDDVLNWVPARLSAVLILVAHGALGRRKLVLRDAPLHRSPNAGWPEAAMAAVLDVALSGPRSYEGEMRDFPYVHPEGAHRIGAGEIDAACAVLWRCWIWIAVLAAVMVAGQWLI